MRIDGMIPGDHTLHEYGHELAPLLGGRGSDVRGHLGHHTAAAVKRHQLVPIRPHGQLRQAIVDELPPVLFVRPLVELLPQAGVRLTGPVHAEVGWDDAAGDWTMADDMRAVVTWAKDTTPE